MLTDAEGKGYSKPKAKAEKKPKPKPAKKNGGGSSGSKSSRGGGSGGGSAILKNARSYIGEGGHKGDCLAWVSTVAGTKGRGQTTRTANEAIAQARANGDLHNSKPPVGAIVGWTGGSTGYGHVAVVSKYVNGKPYVISTGVNGRVAEVPMSYFGGSLNYKGWLSSLNGITLKKVKGGDTGEAGGGASARGTDVGTQSSRGGGGGSGGSGGGSGAYGYSKKEMYEYLNGMFGDVKILKELDDDLVKKGEGKSIDWLIDTLVKKRITDATVAATYMAQTGFFKKYSVDIANRLVQEKQRPGVAKGDITAKRQAILAAMNAEGIHLSGAELNKLARDAWVYGWSDDQISAKIATAKSVTLSGGQWDDAVTNMARYADDYGVAFTDSMHKQFKNDYLNNRGAGNVQDLLRDQAAARYSVFAGQIQAGQTVRALADGYFQQAAQLLEVDPNTLKWDDPLFKNGRAFTTTDANGKAVVRNMDDFERLIKQDNRWMTTTNAKETISNGVYNLMQRMGLAG